MHNHLEKFFDSLREIVNGQGSWQQKKTAIQAFADSEGFETELEELVGWFSPEEE